VHLQFLKNLHYALQILFSSVLGSLLGKSFQCLNTPETIKKLVVRRLTNMMLRMIAT
jgi:hypothetical protein